MSESMSDFLERARRRDGRQERRNGLHYWFDSRPLPKVDLDERRFMYQTLSDDELITHEEEIRAWLEMRRDQTSNSEESEASQAQAGESHTHEERM